MTFRFAIIGTGLTGTSMLYQFIRQLQTKISSGLVDPHRVHILLFDKQPVAGPGFPHNEYFVQPYHITNMCAGEMSVVYSNPQDFSDWIESRRSDLIDLFPAFRAILCDPAYQQNGCSHYPRALMGEYLKVRFKDALQFAEALGINVEVHLDCEVTNIVDDRKGVCIQVRSNKHGSNSCFSANRVLLATGHWPRTSSGPGYFSTPWPARRLLAQIPQDAAVAVIGSSLSAIETALTLTSDGNFSRTRSGDLRFEPMPDSRRITLLSRHGLLPRVRTRNLQYHPRFFTQGNLRSLLRRESGNLSLDTIFNLFDKEIATAMGQPVDWQSVISPKGSPISRLESDLRQARNGAYSGGSALWQSILRQVFPLVRELYLALSDTERQRFDRDYVTLFFAHAATQPPVNAEKVLALMRAGVLEVVKLGHDYRFTSTANGPGYEFSSAGKNSNTLAFRYVVDARGQESSLHNNPSELIQNLVKSGNIHLGERIREKPKNAEVEVHPLAATHLRSTESVWIDPDTHRVMQVNRKGSFSRSKTLFAVGAMTRAQIIDVSMARGLTRSTDCIARQLVDWLTGKPIE